MKTEAERQGLERAPGAKASGPEHKNPVLRFMGELPGLVIMALVLSMSAWARVAAQGPAPR